MTKYSIINELEVQNKKIGVMRVGNVDYISLTDLARYNDKNGTDYVIQNWMRTFNSILFLGTWEVLNNENFNSIEFDGFKNKAGSNSFYMSPQKWIRETNAIGIISKSGKYGGGTYAHPDIAFEFASWLSPEFKLYLIKEFERLKAKEANEEKLDWQANRLLSKLNYHIHTDAIKNYIVPTLTDKQKSVVYANEADLLNVALFGMTAKEWKNKNKDKKGNIRDYADLFHLVILNNLENINAELIKLNETAKNQIKVLENNINIEKLEMLELDIKKQIRNLICCRIQLLVIH